jgi:NAD(P)-dependent dehydrogenase (short-subunit alcohol dehydrogenase family)/acyl carrier protein
MRLRRHGVYVITGGLGGLGYSLAGHLAREYAARLVLVGRTSLPPRESWAAALADGATDAQVRRRIGQILALEAAGAEVLPLSADIGRRSEVQEVIDRVRARFGSINGVLHAAGVPGQGLIQFKEAEAAAEVLWPKLQGTMALAACLEDEGLDFMVLFSSLNAIIGGLGEADYCAANAYLDAFAHHRRSRRSWPAVSINWGPWQWDAWQSSLVPALAGVSEDIGRLRREYGITTEEGVAALYRAMSTSLPQVLASPLAPEVVANRWGALTSLENLTKAHADAERPRYRRPELRTPYVPPRNSVEEKIAAIWARALALDRVGIHDHFFELGGNSLLSVAIVSDLERELGVTLSAALLYEGPTVSALAELIGPARETEPRLAGHVERGRRRHELREQRRRSPSTHDTRRSARP